MSAPRSNRVEASVLRPRRLLVRRTDAGLKYALSKTTVLVVAETSEDAPPITPPTARARCRRGRAPHHLRGRLCAIAIGDDQHLRVECPRDAVERRDRLAGARAACMN